MMRYPSGSACKMTAGSISLFSFRSLLVGRSTCLLATSHSLRLREEALDLVKVYGPGCRGERVQHVSAVAFGVQARVQDRHDAPVLARAQQAAHPLLEQQDDLRQHIPAEPVLAPGLHGVHDSLVKRVVRGSEGQPVDHDQRERFTRDVYAFPERLQAEEDRALLPETPDEVWPVQLALPQDGEREVARNAGVDIVQHAAAREQEKGAPARGQRQALHALGNDTGVVLGRLPGIGWYWQVARNIQQRMAAIIEHLRQHALDDLSFRQAHLPPEEGEVRSTVLLRLRRGRSSDRRQRR